VSDEYSKEPTNTSPFPTAVAAGCELHEAKTKTKAHQLTLDQCLVRLKEVGETFMGEGDRVFRMGIPCELVQLAWDEFKRSRLTTGEMHTVEGWRRQMRATVRQATQGLWRRAEGGLVVASDRAEKLLAERANDRVPA
jgi:hypothetical protein